MNLPPPTPPRLTVSSANDGPAPTARWWTRQPKWKRLTAYGVGVFVVLGAIGAATTDSGEDGASAIDTSEVTFEPDGSTSDGVGSTSAATVEPTSAATTTAVPTTAVDSTTVPTAAVPTTAATIVAPSTSPPVDTVPGSMLALDVLAMVPIENEHRAGYDRDLFGYGDTADSHGCRTRAVVLRRDSLTPAQVDPVGCAVVAGDWYSTYDGTTWTDPAEIEIDHVVALKEAWDSGAWSWDPTRLEAFGNDVDDLRSLQAVTGSENQAKGDKDPSNWIPPRTDAVCGFLADWTAIKARWGLSMDQSEHGRIRNLLGERCPEQTIAPWSPAPGGVARTSPTEISPVATEPPANVSEPVAPEPSGNCDPSYPGVCIPSGPDLDCGEISYRRFEVLPPDPHRFDADHDGIGCES